MKRTRQRPRLTLEALEARETPAGIVNVKFANGNLLLVGDNEANYLDIYHQPDGRVLIGDLANGTRFRLNGGPEMMTVSPVNPVTGNVILRLANGADTVFFNGLSLAGSLNVHGGNGHNTVTFIGGTTVKRNIVITNGADIDKTNLTGPMRVGGNVTIANGAGDSVVKDNPNTDLRIDGTFRILNGFGNDTIAFENAQVLEAGRIAIHNGAGGGSIKIAPINGLEVDQHLTVISGNGNDLVRIGNFNVPVLIQGSLLVNVGADLDRVDLLGSPLIVEGRLSVVAGAGTDIVVVDSYPASSVRGRVDGSTTIALGAGTNQLAHITNMWLNGSLSITSPTVGANAGFDRISLYQVYVKLGTFIATGASSDSIAIDASHFNGAFLVSTGAGDDIVTFEQKSSALDTRFIRSVGVNTGAGNDIVLVGSAGLPTGIENRVIFFASNRWYGGAGTQDSIYLWPGNSFVGSQPIVVGFE